MPVPSWATAMVQNYRDMFRAKTGYPTKLMDGEIWDICNTVFNDESSALQDQDRVQAMQDMED